MQKIILRVHPLISYSNRTTPTYWSSYFITSRNFLITKVLSQKKQESTKLWTLDNIDRLKFPIRSNFSCIQLKPTWSSATMKLTIWRRKFSWLKGSRLVGSVGPTFDVFSTIASEGWILCSLQRSLYSSRCKFLMCFRKPPVPVVCSYCQRILEGNFSGSNSRASLLKIIRSGISSTK